jgi:hypothetical protein
MAISEIYALSGPHAADLRKANAALIVHNGGAAAEDLRAILAKLPPDDPSLPYVAARSRVADWLVGFESGEWVDVQPKDNLGGWTAVAGDWQVEGDALLARPNVNGDTKDHQMMLVWTAGDLDGRAFELAGRFEFVVEPGPGKEAGNGGPALHSPTTRYYGYVQFDRDDQKARFVYDRTNPPLVDADVHAANDFVFRRDADGTITTLLNGEPALEPFKVPRRQFLPPLRFGVGGIGRAPVRFTNLRLRKIVAPDAPKPADPAEPGGALPF